MSEFTKISYKKQFGRVPTYEELCDKAVMNLVNSLRRMLAEYEMHASNLDPCMREEEGMACKELKEMELLRMMMRIILDAFESIYQRIQVIQFKMNKELSSKSILLSMIKFMSIWRFKGLPRIFRGNWRTKSSKN